MSWLENRREVVRLVGAIGLVAALAVVSGCTVRPLYGTTATPTGAIGSAAASLSSIAIDPIQSREGLEVRNALIFLFNGGQGQPAAPRYRLKLDVQALTVSVASRQVISTDQEPTAESTTVSAVYGLTDVTDGKVVATGKRQITASYDVPGQEFAAVRAERDARDRAARELAELLRLAIAQDMDRLGKL